MAIRFSGLIAPVEVPTGDSRMFKAGKLTHRPLPLPLLARFSSGGHDGATVVGRIDKIYDGPGGYWADGEFLDPREVPEVSRAIYMIKNKVMGPSVDLDRDFTVSPIKHPMRPDKQAGLFSEYNVIGATLVPMPAFHQVHLSLQSDEDRTILASVGINPEDWIYFDVNNRTWDDLPIAPRDYRFDADDAVKRIAYWAGVGSREPNLNRYASAFLWRDGNQMGDTLAQDSFRLPLIDIVNSQPYLIYHAVYAAAALLSGGHGGLPNIPQEDKQRMVPVINGLYAMFADAFGDPNLKSPFLTRVRPEQAAIDSDCGCSPESTENATEESVLMEPVFNTVTTTNGGSLTIGGYTLPVANIVLTVGDPTFSDSTNGEFARRNPKEPYGDVEYADPGYQEDGKKRYPLDSEEHCRAAWSYINMPKNAAKYSPDELKRIKGKIRKALETYGVEVSEDSDEAGEMSLDPRVSSDFSALLAGVGTQAPLAPPAVWFDNPGLIGPTKLTVDDNGHVYGHLAQWKVCHVGVGNKCVIAPKSKTHYRLFRSGTLLLEDGTPVEVGKITLGTGHANAQWGVVPSREHYDNSGWAAAVVNVGEDKHGIWVNGSLTASMTPERIAELRRSPLSGDWREVNGNLELIAALAVNNPGFPIYREHNGQAFSLVAVGVIGQDDDVMADFSVSGTEFTSVEPDEDEEEVDAVEVEEEDETEVPVDDETDDAVELSLRLERWAEIEADLKDHRQEVRGKQFASLTQQRLTQENRPAFDQFGIQLK